MRKGVREKAYVFLEKSGLFIMPSLGWKSGIRQIFSVVQAIEETQPSSSREKAQRALRL